jgi:hypothetical protein
MRIGRESCEGCDGAGGTVFMKARVFESKAASALSVDWDAGRVVG